MPDDTTVRMTTQLWSEAVARADAAEGEPVIPKVPAYPFTGHTFMQPDVEPYAR